MGYYSILQVTSTDKCNEDFSMLVIDNDNILYRLIDLLILHLSIGLLLSQCRSTQSHTVWQELDRKACIK